MKYILVECIEREINPPALFDTHEKAIEEMHKRMAEVLHVEPEELENLEEDEDYKIGISCDDNAAWINDCHHNNYDWKIFEMEF